MPWFPPPASPNTLPLCVAAASTAFLAQAVASLIQNQNQIQTQQSPQPESSQILREDEGQTTLEPVSILPQRILDQGGLASLPLLTTSDVAQHNSINDAWFVVHGLVYDASRFVSKHPGGWTAMAQYAGAADATDPFEAYHPARVHRILLPSMLVGRLADFSPAGNDVDEKMRLIRQELLRQNLFACQRSYYVPHSIRLGAQFVGAVALTLDRNWWSLGAVAMGMFWQQVAFVGHDVGHNAISQKRTRDLWWGVTLGNTVMGISLGWWKLSHNVHHLNCNSVENDPDIQHMPIFAVSDTIVRERFWSTYHKKYFDMDAISRFLISYQHFLFYPVMAVARVNLYLQSWLMLLLQVQGPTQFRFTEMVSLLAFNTWVYTLISYLPNPTTRSKLIWISIAHAVSGLLHVQICISHFPMEVHRNADPARKKGFFSVQLQTTLNVDTPEWLDWLHGGLQFQIEHHMFPRLPRHNLRPARQLVRAALSPKELKEEYYELDFLHANLFLLSRMREAAQVASTLKKGDAGFYHSPLYDGLNAVG